eukprot:1135946-Prymnesium_polylepis.1
MLALILLADYDKLADRFVGRMPPNAAAELFTCGTHDKDAVARPTCPVSHDEAVELIKGRLRAIWWGPRAKHTDAKLLSKECGQVSTRDGGGGGCGWRPAAAPIAGR